MKKALFAGSFDPPTWGHIRLIQRASKLFEQLVVGIGKNLKKGESFFTTQEKKEGLQKEILHLSNVKIIIIPGLVANFAREHEIDVLVRGLRFPSDMEYEIQMAHANHTLTGIETLFLAAEGNTAMISSSLIREMVAHKAPLNAFIPQYFENLLYKQ